jgi:hypothetical protein
MIDFDIKRLSSVKDSNVKSIIGELKTWGIEAETATFEVVDLDSFDKLVGKLKIIIGKLD